MCVCVERERGEKEGYRFLTMNSTLPTHTSGGGGGGWGYG